MTDVEKGLNNFVTVHLTKPPHQGEEHKGKEYSPRWEGLGRGAVHDFIAIRGARNHNLKGINVDIPRDRLTVITGVSGSGKSSLAFDTIYAEGQRRYIESLSSYARQFLDQIQKPDVEHIEGLPPTIAIEQRASPPSPRSTVATVTEIYDYLRLLYAKIGAPFCYHCKCIISRQTIDQMVQKIMEFPQKTRIMLLAPLVKGKKVSIGKYSNQYYKKALCAPVSTILLLISRPSRNWRDTKYMKLM